MASSEPMRLLVMNAGLQARPCARSGHAAERSASSEERAAEAARTTNKPTRLQRARALAKAMARTDRLRAQLAEALAAEDAAFGPFAAGRAISRDQARTHLTSIGLLQEQKP